MTMLTPMMVSLLLLTGLGVALLGSVKVALAERLHISEDRVGGLVSLFGFVLCPVIFAAGFLTDHLGKQVVLLAGSGLYAAGLYALALARTYRMALTAVVLFSAAWALLINVGNVLTPAAFPSFTEPQAYNFGNVFFGLGAFLTPLGVAWLLRRTSWTFALSLLAVVALVPGMLTLGLSFSPENATEAPFLDLLANPLMWLCGMTLFFYGPLEASMGAWTTTYLQGRGVDERKATRFLAGFWLAYMAARLTAALTLQKGTERLLLLGLAVASVAVLIGMVRSRRPGTALGLVIAAGLAFGPVFPTVLSVLLEKIPDQQKGRAVGLFFAIGGVGWTFIPMLIGVYAARVGVQRAFIIAVGAACGLVAVVSLLAMR